MRQQQAYFYEKQVAVVVVTFDSEWLAREYAKSTQLDWPLLLDDDQQLYKSYGFSRASWWSAYGPVTSWRHIKLMLQGFRLGKMGKDFLQLGGDVLVDPQGVIRLYYASHDPHDRPDFSEIQGVIDRADE